MNVRLIISEEDSNRPYYRQLSDNFDTVLIPNYGWQEWNRMHDKFCIIDFEYVMHGSYNWTKVAEYNDERRNSVYYILGDRFFCCDRNANTTTEIIINNKYEHIQRTFLSPRRSRIFIVVDCGHFAYNRITDGLQLWVLNTYNNNYRKVAEGFAVREEKGNIIVSKGDYCLNSNDRKAIRRWKAKDHIFDYTGKVVWTQGRYEVNEKEIKQMN